MSALSFFYSCCCLQIFFFCIHASSINVANIFIQKSLEILDLCSAVLTIAAGFRVVGLKRFLTALMLPVCWINAHASFEILVNPIRSSPLQEVFQYGSSKVFIDKSSGADGNLNLFITFQRELLPGLVHRSNIAHLTDIRKFEVAEAADNSEKYCLVVAYNSVLSAPPTKIKIKL